MTPPRHGAAIAQTEVAWLTPPASQSWRGAGACANVLKLTAAALPILAASFADTANAEGHSATSSTTSIVSPRRAVPDYDGRGPEATRPSDVALWVPRIILSPLYLVSEYLLRWPLSIAIPAAEQADLPRKIYDFFTFGPEHTAGIVPVGMVKFGFNPSIGVYAFWDDALFTGHQLRLHIEVWPTDWYAASTTERIRIDPRRAAEFRVSEVHRPDDVFYGIGPDTLQSSQSRYTQQTVDAAGVLQWRFWRQSRAEASSGIRIAEMTDGHYGSDPSLTREAATGAFAVPYGFDRGYTVQYNRLEFTLDSRQPWPAFDAQTTSADERPGSGVHLDLYGEQGSDVRRSPASGWVRYGGTAGSYVDLNQHGRVVGVAVTTVFVDPTGPDRIPFTELATLGGDGPMRGYYTGRLVDRSAAAAAMHYVWPIGPWLGGSIETAVGNVFDAHLSGFRPGRLRFSGSVGLSTLGMGDYPIELIVGCGSETFEHGGQVDSFRLDLSANHGF